MISAKCQRNGIMQRFALSALFLMFSLSSSPGIAGDNEPIGSIVNNIAARIEGATQGSGSLYKKEGPFYIIITAWHVLSGMNPGEEVDVFINNRRYSAVDFYRHEDSSLDVGYIRIKSSTELPLPKVGDSSKSAMGSEIYVVGFPLETEAVNSRIMRLSSGNIIANTRVQIRNGYQLLYSNITWPGMSGGPILNSNGELIGIHGQSELDPRLTTSRGIAVKTGANQGVPIHLLATIDPNIDMNAIGFSSDDYILFAKESLEEQSWNDAAYFAAKANAMSPSYYGFYYLAVAEGVFGKRDTQAGFSSLEKALSLKEDGYEAHYAKCHLYYRLAVAISARGHYDKLAIESCSASLLHNKGDKYYETSAQNILSSILDD